MGETLETSETLGQLLARGAWRPLLGGFFIHLALGTLYCWANVSTYVTSALREDHSVVSYKITFPVYVLGIFFLALSNPFGGLLEQRVGGFRTVVVGGTGIVGSTLLTAVAVNVGSLLLLYGSAGMLFGISSGLIYMAPIVCGYRWLPRNKVTSAPHPERSHLQ